jgi:hypothetical protein
MMPIKKQILHVAAVYLLEMLKELATMCFEDGPDEQRSGRRDADGDDNDDDHDKRGLLRQPSN